jgi:hypothetical protein
VGGFGCDTGPKKSITNPAKTQHKHPRTIAFVLGGLGAAAAASYVANQLYDGMFAVYMYLAGKGDTADKPRRDKEAKQRATAQAYRQHLQNKYGFSAGKT